MALCRAGAGRSIDFGDSMGRRSPSGVGPAMAVSMTGVPQRFLVMGGMLRDGYGQVAGGGSVRAGVGSGDGVVVLSLIFVVGYWSRMNLRKKLPLLGASMKAS